MKYLVTGGIGFIGSALCLKLLAQEDAHVTCLDAMTYAANSGTLATLSAYQNFEHVMLNICDSARVNEAIAQAQPDIIFHLAAETHVDRSIDGSAVFVETNVMGTYNMIEAALTYSKQLMGASKDAFRFIHISTDEVYGSLGVNGQFTEQTRFDPSSPYSASKAASDHLVSAWHRTYGLATIISNCSNNYGPRQFPEKLIPLMILNAAEGRPLPIYGSGSNVRDWLHVEDHVDALILLSRKGAPGETYNIGGGCELSNLEVVKTICAILDEIFPYGAPHDRLIEFVKDRPGHDLRYAIDASKIHDAFGWAPSYDFTTGLAQTVAWYLSNDEWLGQISDKGGARQRIGLLGRWREEGI